MRARSTGNFGKSRRIAGRPASKSAAKKTAARAKRPVTSSTGDEFANRNNLAIHQSADDQRTASASGVRLQKILADAGIGARRDCEQLIASGRIQVNGMTVTTLPYFINPQRDVVAHDGVAIHIDTDAYATSASKSGNARADYTYVLINKPKGMITTARDPEGRQTVIQMVPQHIAARERLFPVGRLDADSTGLLLLTNDGDLAHQLTHPKFGVLKEYRVTTTGLATDEQVQQLKRGMYLMTPDHSGQPRSRRASVADVRVLKRFVDRSRGDRTVLTIKLREGQNREIRRLLARIGLKVRELERVAIGPLRGAGLKLGDSRLLGKRDVDRLRASVLDEISPTAQRARVRR